jgi:hypothetical protein
MCVIFIWEVIGNWDLLILESLCATKYPLYHFQVITRGVSHCGLAIYIKNPLKETKILQDIITL